MAQRKRTWSVATVLVLALVAMLGWWLWRWVSGPATTFSEPSKVLYIRTGAGLDEVIDSLEAIGAIEHAAGFRWLSERKNYTTRVRPGRYRIEKGMSLNALVNRLRAGEQEPVRVTFANIAYVHELAGKLGRVLEPDSLAFLQAFMDPDLQREVGLNEETIISLFIPDTYEFWWTTKPEQFIKRMKREREAFWDQERVQKAKEHGLSPTEVATLASIVQSETVQMGDAPRIARVYLNRLRIGMPLQADPTLKFALGLRDIQRVLNADKEVDSDYNTYKHTGLPPGPITMPEPRFIDAVLDAPRHDFLYFCARADLSGFSDFSKTYEQHLVYAKRYQKALNERGIRR
ncbi:MAG: endolytic transglycosylase MltG [Flavobacteriales bacterium]|nr:endolytic transglycosylase MltG [Flavobacteriales bacterium]